MEFTDFVRKPFVVQAVEITEENIEEVAKYVGTIRHKEDSTPYIQVDRTKVPNVDRVYIGFWMTKMGDNVRCYSPRILKKQYTELTPDIQRWVDWITQMDTDTAPVKKDDAGIV